MLLLIAVFAAVAGSAYGWFSDKSKRLKEDEFNLNLRRQLESDRLVFETQAKEDDHRLKKRELFVLGARVNFGIGYISGRQWLAKFIAEADRALDEQIVVELQKKKRPALRAAEEVAEARLQRREFKERAKFLEYQLLSLKQYFPFLEDYEEIILDESVPLNQGHSNSELLDESDPVLKFVNKSEYEALSEVARSQLALERYLSGALSPAAIGRLYERYLGHLYEQDGWAVEYHGIVKGLEDLGRDLICFKGNEVKIVQAKCWAKQKTIHEKHIFQLFGTMQLYAMNCASNDNKKPSIKAVFVTTTSLSPVARQAAAWLQVDVEENKPLSKSFPMIKCNINQASKEKIYHLPFDQQYDRTKILTTKGERIVLTVAEAEKLGFRRAFRFSGT